MLQMFKPLSLFLGWRYTRARKRQHFISFISLASMLGIGLGVTVLITVLSVMNGFDFQIRSRFFAVAPQVTVTAPASKVQKGAWRNLQKKMATNSEIQGSAPFVSGDGMLIVDGVMHPLRIMGVLPRQEARVSQIAGKMIDGKFTNLAPKRFRIIIGKSLAERFNLSVGDKVNLVTPRTTVTLAGVFPVYRQFTISGIFHTTGGFAIDNVVGYVHMADAASLFGQTQSQNGLHIKLHNATRATAVSKALTSTLPSVFFVSNWTDQFGPFSQALDMEKMMMFIILLLIVAVAAFNLVSTLVMVVNDKQSEIAILRTLGAMPGTIMCTFIWQGVIVGAIGTLLGIIGGVALSLHITAIATWLQQVFHVQLISSEVYLLDFLPSKLALGDVMRVGALAFFMSVLATVYPSYLAFKTQPAEALRYE